MQVSVDGVVLFELSDHQKNVIKNNIKSDVFDADMKRRLQWVLNHKYEMCMKELESEWLPVLKQRVPQIPSSPEAFANLVFSQPDYKDMLSKSTEVQNK